MINLYHNLLPRILEIIKAFTVTDEKRACEVMEILDELVESAVSVVVPHTTLIIQLCLELGSTKTMDEMVKVKVISFIGWFTRTKTSVSYSSF